MGVVDEHGGGDVHAPVDHFRQQVVLHGAGWLGAFIIPNLTVTHALVPHVVKDFGVVAVGEDQHGRVGVHGGHQVPVGAGDVQDADGGQVDVGVFGKILQPG